MITKRPFGKDETGREMTLFTMTNRTGASVSVTDFGGHLVSIRVPDREGRLGEVNLGFDELAPYLESHGRILSYYPLFGNVITRFTGAAGGIFPTDAALRRSDYFALGGIDSFKGMGYRFMRSRAYGFSELAVLWQDGYNLSVEAFYQPGLYRGFAPERGWKREQDYGVAFTQYRGNWSVNLYYALRNGENYLDGIIGFGLKTLF